MIKIFAFILSIFQLLFFSCSSTPQLPNSLPETTAAVNIEDSSVRSNKDYKEIQSLYQKGLYESVALKSNEFEKKFPTHPHLLFIRNLSGLSFLQLKKPLLASVEFQKSIQQFPKSSVRSYLEYNLATSYAEGSQWNEAQSVLSQINTKTLNPETQEKVAILTQRIKKQIEFQTPQPQSSPTLSGPTPSPTETPQSADSVGDARKVGLLIPLTGKNEELGKRVLKSVELAFANRQNDSQKPIFQVIAKDAGETPEQAIKAFDELLAEQVSLVIGPIHSKGLETIATKAQSSGTPLITLTQGTPPSYPFVISAGMTALSQVQALVKYSLEILGLKKFAILSSKDKFGETYASLFKAETLKLGGEMIREVQYEPTETDFRKSVDQLVGLSNLKERQAELDSLAQKRKELGITKKTRKTQQYYDLPPIVDFEALFIPDVPKTLGMILPTFAYRDVDKLKFMGPSSWHSQELLDRTQPFSEGSLTVDALSSQSSNLQTQRFLRDFGAFYKDNAPSAIEASAYDTALLVENSLRGLTEGLHQRSEFLNALKDTQGIPGTTGLLSIEEGVLQRKLILFTVEKGRFREAP